MILLMAIRMMEGGLAKQFDQEQVVQEWPGLAQEVAKICLALGIPDVNHIILNKKDINIAMRMHEKSLKSLGNIRNWTR